MSFNLFKRKASNMIKPSTRVFRVQTIEGVAIPAIIHNGSYFLVDIDVYENGRVSCWNFEDFEYFKKDVNKGWVSLSIPDGESISIHGLGSWEIQHGDWLFNKNSFIEYVQEIIRELNPKLENIYHYSQKVINGTRIGESGNGTVYKELKRYPNDPFPEKVNGDSINLFQKKDNSYYLIRVSAFADSSILISRVEAPYYLGLADFEELIERGEIVSEIPTNSAVYIHGLGSFIATEASFSIAIENKLLEIKDFIRELNGQPSAINMCRQDYENYLANPTIANVQRLKTSYEHVPDHLRMYVGDMDTKDVAVRMIIYGGQEIENWSHYQVAKSLGEELPTIAVPKPNNEADND
ncbi:hypothetical protein [Hymenobacter negativus]|uniref:Uncharacterized protein n=1 Tax=Hymenobacter negativus TaxID=2795026 RepID=A0ABS3QCS9_9BACT|nr:hypothetical protein [Hymenobacter negativus]MBO2009049.1 hypothetical protein [Hymenobacter negativus]